MNARDVRWTVSDRFGANVFWLRRQAGLTQQELADRVGMNRVSLGELERGRRVPRLDTILKLGAGMNCSTCPLLAGMRWQSGYFALVGGEFEIEHPAAQLRRSVRR